jgi:hypothetical protein
MQQLRNTSWMALALVGAFSVVACGDDGENGNGQGMGNGNPDMGSVDMPVNGGGDMGPDGGMMEDAGNGEDPVLESLTPSPSTLEIREGQSDTVTITGDFDDGSSMQLSAGDLTLSSADEAVATAQALDDAVQVTGVGQGMTTITVSSGNVSAQVAVTVQPMDPGRTLVTINLTGVNDPIQLEVGDEALFLPRGLYDNTDNELLDPTELTLSSADDTICTLGAQGQQLVATGVAEGTTTLTVELDGVMATIGCEVEPAENCVFGTEGCGCTPVDAPGAANFSQSDCSDPDLRCVPFDDIFEDEWTDTFIGIQTPQGAMATCVRNCETDADCDTASGQVCQNDYFIHNVPGGGLDGICVDRVAGVDELCKLSRRSQNLLQLENNMGQTVTIDRLVPGSELVGCEEGLTCYTNFVELQGRLYDGVSGIVHPDEGVCTEFCFEDGDCDATQGRDRCGLGIIFGNAGFCTDELRLPGDQCGQPPASGNWRGSSLCPTVDGVDQFCSFVEAGVGFCLEVCGQMGTCTSTPTGVAGSDYVCDDSGFCDVSSCGADQGYAEPCEDSDKACREFVFTGTENGQTVVLGTPSMCVEIDALAPFFVPGEVSSQGQLTPGDDCLPNMGVLGDVMSCEKGFACARVQAQTGNPVDNCLPFCQFGEADADDYCEDLIGTGSTCIDASNTLVDLLTGNQLSSAGLCTTP